MKFLLPCKGHVLGGVGRGSGYAMDVFGNYYFILPQRVVIFPGLLIPLLQTSISPAPPMFVQTLIPKTKIHGPLVLIVALISGLNLDWYTSIFNISMCFLLG